MAWVPVVVLAVVWVVIVVGAVGPTVVERRPEGALPTRSGCLLGVLTLLPAFQQWNFIADDVPASPWCIVVE